MNVSKEEVAFSKEKFGRIYSDSLDLEQKRSHFTYCRKQRALLLLDTLTTAWSLEDDAKSAQKWQRQRASKGHFNTHDAR